LIVALLFAIVWMSLRGVKFQLRSAVSEMEGTGPVAPESPLGEHQGLGLAQQGLGLGVRSLHRQHLHRDALELGFRIGVYGGDTVEHYKPEQPIKFNHTLHAGKADKGNLQINCIYCHSFAEKSKHSRHPQHPTCA
jgi:hypothetical protein